MNAIEIRALNLWYGSFQALRAVSLEVKQGEVTALIGPSGCGKSTLLRCCNRINERIAGVRTEGSIRVLDTEIHDANISLLELRKSVGMVFQRPNPFPTMSIADNVLAGKRLNSKRINKSDAEELVEKSLRSANLWDEVKDRLAKPGSGLSGGQQQRLCIARAIAVDPEILLMDEPCSALDPISTLAIEQLMNELKSTYTIVIVTHNMQQAARVSQRTAFFTIDGTGQPGYVVEMDDTDVMFSNPKQQSTIDYVTGRFG